VHKRRTNLWRNERLGLALIAASLTVIVVIVTMLLSQQRAIRRENVRQQATELLTLLAAIPLESHGQIGSARALARGPSVQELAYAVIVDESQRVIDAVISPGLLLPPAEIVPAGTVVAEREVTVAVNGADRSVLEFASPLGNGGATARLAFYRPSSRIAIDELPFLATLALAVFLLTPVFYLLLRNEIRPLRAILAAMEKLIGAHRPEAHENAPRGVTLGAMLQSMHGFTELAQARLNELETENTRLLTSAKLLAYQKQRLAGVMEALPDSVILLDESGTAIFANAKVQALFGVAPEEVVGRTCEEWCKDRKIVEFVHRSNGKSVARRLMESLEFAPSASSDRIYSLRVWPLAVGQDAGAHSGTLLIFRDVTAENRAAESRGQFVAHLAHELKTPLNVLGMYSESLQMSGGLEESARIEAVNAISDEVQRLALLIDNLLNITRIEMGSLKLERQRVNLKELLQDAFNHVARSGRERSLQFRMELPETLSAAALDKGLLRVALNNLLTNAIKYSNPGGTVTLGAEETADKLCIYVSDTGIGIRREDQERIFDRFFRADDEQTRSRSGHGLGLSLARDIVQLHHGTLVVESALGEGSKFTIELWKDTMALRQAS
jgi:PAS domain S-box-containing protein